MKNKVFYQTRPNKHIDRSVFVYILEKIDRIYPLDQYVYCGFGSFSFEDFKLVHSRLGINSLISLEADAKTYARANYNKPIQCINIIHSTSTEYITDLDFPEDENHIFWLDFTTFDDIAQQFSDYCNLISKLNPYDIVRITLNANASNLYSEAKIPPQELQSKRYEALRTILDKYVPINFEECGVQTENFPDILLASLRNATNRTLMQTPYDKRFLQPLFATTYADGQKMLTFTGIILTEAEEVQNIGRKANCELITFNWDQIHKIDIEPLTQKELLDVNMYMPSDGVAELQRLCDDMPFLFSTQKSIERYRKYYKFYPNFHHINLL